MLGSVSVLVSRYFGMKDYEVIRLVLSKSFLLGLLLSIPTMIIIWYVPTILQYLSKQDTHIMQLATKYLHALVWYTLPLIFLVVIEQFLIGIHKTRFILYVSLLRPLHHKV